MASATFTLTAEKRTKSGHRSSVNLLRAGKFPAVTYGHGLETQSLTLSFAEFLKVYKEAGESTILTLAIDGEKKNVLIHDVQHDPVRGTPIHADFFQVKMDEEITADVPLVFSGTSLAVKEDGGTLLKNFDSLEVTALPADLPREIAVDISILKTFDDAITLKDLDLPENITVDVEDDQVIAVVTPPRTEEEMAALDEEISEDVESIEDVEEKKEKEGEDGEEAAEGEEAPTEGGDEKAEGGDEKNNKKEKKEEKK